MIGRKKIFNSTSCLESVCDCIDGKEAHDISDWLVETSLVATNYVIFRLANLCSTAEGVELI